MKKKTYILISAVIVVGVAAYLASDYIANPQAYVTTDTTPQPSTIVTDQFARTGYLSDQLPDKPNEGLSFVYEEPGSPALSFKLRFGSDSLCVTEQDPAPCSTIQIEKGMQNKRVYVEGTRDGDTLLVKTLAIDIQANRSFGYITSARVNGINGIAEIDSIEFLSGDAAVKAAAQDTECTEQNASECTPSLNNDYYIRNQRVDIHTYNLTSDTKVRIFKNPGSPVLEDVTMEEFLRRYEDTSEMMKSYPFMYVLDGALVTYIEEQYIP